MTAEQLRMARALLRISVRELAMLARVDPGTVINIEAGKKGQAATVARLREVLQNRGVVFIGALEPFHAPGCALRWGEKAPEAVTDDEADGEIDEGNGTAAQPWDEAERRLDSEEIEGMRRYWAEAGRWERLSEPSRKALRRAMGQEPSRDVHH